MTSQNSGSVISYKCSLIICCSLVCSYFKYEMITPGSKIQGSALFVEYLQTCFHLFPCVFCRGVNLLIRSYSSQISPQSGCCVAGFTFVQSEHTLTQAGNLLSLGVPQVLTEITAAEDSRVLVKG